MQHQESSSTICMTTEEIGLRRTCEKENQDNHIFTHVQNVKGWLNDITGYMVERCPKCGALTYEIHGEGELQTADTTRLIAAPLADTHGIPLKNKEAIWMRKRINSIEELKTESKDGAEFFILLRPYLRSSKYIWWDEQAGHFEVINHIDGSEQVLSESEMMDKSLTNIGEAIEKGSFFKD